MAPFDLLQTTPLFSGLEDEALHALAAAILEPRVAQPDLAADSKKAAGSASAAGSPLNHVN